MKQPELVNLKDVALKANVSISTVSRVLQNKGELSAETRERILRIARQCGYHENRLSRSIRTGKSGLVGVLLGYFDSFFGQIARAIEETLLEHDYLPVLLSQPDVSRMFHRLAEQRVEGIILISNNDKAGNSFFEELSSSGIPVVAMDRRIPADVSFVGTDNELGGRLGAEHLIALGHRRIGCYCGAQKTSSGFLRLKGFSDVCREHGLPCTVLGKGGWDRESDRALLKCLQTHHDLTAIGCMNDAYAYQVIRLAGQLGKRVPEDLSVLGFGNQPLPDKVPVGLSTLEQKPLLLGRTAAEILFRQMQDHSLPPEIIQIPPELIAGNSTAQRKKQSPKNIKQKPKK